MLVREVAVVVGATASIGPPAMAAMVGARSARSASWSQPRPSSTNSTTCAASRTGSGNQAGRSEVRPGPSSEGTRFVRQAPA